MDEKKGFPPMLRIRVTDGAFKNQWLWTIGVSQGNVPFSQVNWDAVYRDWTKFHFSFAYTPDQSAGFRPITEAVANSIVGILKNKGVAAEVVTETP